MLPVVEPARLRVLANCQIPSLSATHIAVPSAENVTLMLLLRKAVLVSDVLTLKFSANGVMVPSGAIRMTRPV